jgi:hypothetical protein
MHIDFTLPTHFEADMDYSLIQKVKAHLEEISLQEQAHHIMHLFEEHPNLASFSLSQEYESDDEGGQYMYLGIYSCELLDEDAEGDVDIRDAISETLNEVKDENFSNFYYILSKEDEITRDNVEKSVRIAMHGCIENSYGKWQVSREKAKLEASVDDNQVKSSSLKL